MVDVIVQHGRQQVVGRADGMEVPSKVQVDIFHRNDLGIATPSGAPFDPKDWAKGGFAQGDGSLLANQGQGISQTY